MTARFHMSVPEEQELSIEEVQTLLNGPVTECHPLPDGRALFYGSDQDVTEDQAEAIEQAWQAGKITGFGIGQ